jgi:hypothetical protein
MSSLAAVLALFGGAMLVRLWQTHDPLGAIATLLFLVLPAFMIAVWRDVA